MAGGKHDPLASVPAFTENLGQDRALGKRLAAAASFSLEWGKKRLKTFPQIIRDIAKVDWFHNEYRSAKLMPNIL